MEMEAVVADLEEELAFDGVEPFVLVVMHVARRAALRVERVLQDQETAAILRRHLEGDGANAESPLLAKAVGAGCDAQARRTARRTLQRVAHRVASVFDRHRRDRRRKASVCHTSAGSEQWPEPSTFKP